MGFSQGAELRAANIELGSWDHAVWCLLPRVGGYSVEERNQTVEARKRSALELAAAALRAAGEPEIAKDILK